jgi:hypothetical protein
VSPENIGADLLSLSFYISNRYGAPE